MVAVAVGPSEIGSRDGKAANMRVDQIWVKLGVHRGDSDV